jgi:phage tail-like protein
MRSTAIERLLPALFQRGAGPGTVLGALLEVMAALHEPDEALLERIDELFSPYRTPDAFVPFLARWVALDVSLCGDGTAPPPIPVGRLRDLVASGAALAQWRGTVEGMTALLRTALGVADITVEEPADRPFHFVVALPAAAGDRIGLVKRIVEAAKPAATTCEIRVNDATKEPAP